MSKHIDRLEFVVGWLRKKSRGLMRCSLGSVWQNQEITNAEMYELAAFMIEDLAKRVPRWISVHDALPGMDEKVLFIPACNHGSVYIGKMKYVGEVNAVYFVVNNWRRTVTYSATHWMPLPEPPEEGEK